MEVIGVAKVSHYRTKLETRKPFFYVSLRQNFAVQGGLLIRTREAVSAMNPPWPVKFTRLIRTSRR